MVQNILEKLHLKEEKNLLIQGLPSSIEKQFSKLSFAKNVTPLLKSRKIDFALVFAINERQLNDILKDVLPALREGGKLWVSYPKKASKIVTDLDRKSSWDILYTQEYKASTEIAVDHVWTAMRFKKINEPDEDETEETLDVVSDSQTGQEKQKDTKALEIPAELKDLLRKNKDANKTFDTLLETNKREFIDWILTAKKDVTREKRLKDTIDKLVAGKKNPSEK